MAYNVGKSVDGIPNRGWPLYLSSVVMVIIAGLFVAARLAVRCSIGRLGWDDYNIIAALIASAILSVTECLAVVHGYGKHMRDLNRGQIFLALKWFYAAQVVYKVVITLYKTSILCLYLRIFIDKNFRRICYAGNIFIGASGLAYIIATIFQCTPVSAFWTRSRPYHCFNPQPFWLSYALINIITDFVILALPARQIYHLRLPLVERIGLMAVFALGAFVCVTSIIRTTTLASSARNPDFTWGPIPATVWSVIEANSGIICACLPVLRRPMASILRPFVTLFPRVFGSKLGSASAGTDQNTAIERKTAPSTATTERISWQWNHSGEHLDPSELPMEPTKAKTRGSEGIAL